MSLDLRGSGRMAREMHERKAVRLRELAKVVSGAAVAGDGDPEVRDVRLDSRAVGPGDLFVAVSGAAADGAAFVKDAIARGAVAIAWERSDAIGVPAIVVPEPRRAIGALAAALHGRPTQRLPVVGITGTNGKTTTSYLVAGAIEAAGGTAARVGTLGARIGGADEPLAHTTPEADQVHRLAARALASGDRALVMEVSSHALTFGRVDGVRFRVAAFTNLTQDHLDFHGGLDDYFAAKRRLFVEHAPESAVVAIDDAWGRRLAAEVPGARTVSTDPGSDAAFRPERASFDRDGLVATVRTPGGAVEVRSPLVGRHNLQNVLVALAIADALGIDGATAARGIGSVARISGRLDPAAAPDGVRAFVDYSHTPDALARALEALRPLTPGRIVCVFGCGGDRDRTKRAPMGEAAARGADVAIATTDNPRTEDPLAILEDVRPGLVAAGRPAIDVPTLLGGAQAGTIVEPDRRRAIALALAAATPGDVVLVAGKGHEDYQIVGTTKRPFDDRVECAKATEALVRGWRSSAATLAVDAGGTLEGGPAERTVRGVSTDTRTIAPGSAFFALSGPSFDAHDFLDAALAGGARIGVVRRDATVPAGLPVVRVDDPLAALGRVAAAHLARWRTSGRPVVAITGSSGKTTTKELVAGALGPRALATRGNFNNLVGLPLTLLRLDADLHDFAVLEMGTSAPGEIASLASLTRPDVAVVTHAAAAHTLGLGTVEAVAQEKASIWSALAAGGTAIVNADDARLVPLAPARRITFGRDASADVRIAGRRAAGFTSEVDLATPKGPVRLALRLLGTGAVEDAAAAVAVAVALGRDLAEVAERLGRVEPIAGRLRPRSAHGGFTVLDDAYNANPRSMTVAIETLVEVAAPGARIAVLGDMFELGDAETAAHEAVGRALASAGVRAAILCGARMAHAARAAVAHGLAKEAITTLPDGQGAAVAVRAIVGPGDVVLVKASHGMRLDRVADALAKGEG